MRHASIPSRITIIVAATIRAAEIALRAPDGVIGDDQVEQAVVVGIEPGGGYAERIWGLGADSRARRDVRECPVPIVVVQGVSAGGTKEEVRVAVVVIVAGRDSEVEA